jgi:hypothetical protein
LDAGAFTAWLDELTARLGADARVVGLVALGSTADPARRDRWSDHDLFVVTVPGAQEALRTDRRWLPATPPAIAGARETEHGLALVLDGPHLVELAVFDLDELWLARIGAAAVLLDRGGVAERVAAVRAATEAALPGPRPDADAVTLGLVQLLVGAGRVRRGERLAGRRRITASAVDLLLPLLVRHATVEAAAPAVGATAAPAATAAGDAPPSAAPTTAEPDPLDPLRRLEQHAPNVAAALEAALREPDPLDTARALLALVDGALRGHVEGYPAALADALRATLTPDSP